MTVPLAAADRALLGELYAQHHPRVLRLCRYLLGSVEEAEDAANDIFLRLPSALATYDKAQPFAPWLARVTSNYCIDLLRRRRSEQRILSSGGAETRRTAARERSPFDQLLRQEESRAVSKALAVLPEHYRQPLLLRYRGELGYHEIAQNLGLTRANVATLIFRAKEGLRHALAPQGNVARAAEWAWNPTR
jgi:RNA polymerase sigma-70 factor (ECF subfamily)